MEERSWYKDVTLMLEQELILYFALNVNLPCLLHCHEKYELLLLKGDKLLILVCAIDGKELVQDITLN